MDISQEELDAFGQFLRKKGMAANTILSYQGAVRQLARMEPDLSAESLQAYRQYLIRTYRPGTVNARIYGVRQYLRYVQHPQSFQQQAKALPTPDLLPMRRQQAPYLNNVISNEDYARLKQYLKREGNDFWYLIVHFLGSTGARVSELVQIKAEHLRLGYMDLYSKGGKIRRIYFPDSLCEEALEWTKKNGITSGFLFLTRTGHPITPRGINSQLKGLARRCHIDPDTVYAHSFRHLYAKNFLKKCGDISLLADLLGHESIETTKIYLTQTSDEQKSLLDRIVTW